ncbi:endophilin-A2-like [Dendronephthya gigantea]|uniref:endophilin-A2-like n=1 Tax=Dendronephthya gigantea TaxID=151771 RepID=UPI00106A3040|nr:endophilin-A2-like [Dendronephthya gigantea]
MSLAGFKKQWNKANQFMSEKVGNVKGTQLDEEFQDLEKRTDATAALVVQLLGRTKEYLQPNPNARAKLSMQSAVAKARGHQAPTRYPQTESTLGEAMSKGQQELGDESLFGDALGETGEVFKRLGEIKDNLDAEVKQNFLDPLYLLESKEIKEINHHRKKMEGRRLDFDCKKRKGSKIPPEEIRAAEDKFESSKTVCYNAMLTLTEGEDEQITQLTDFVKSVMEYHQQSYDILETLVSTLDDKVSEASSRPRKERRTEHEPKWTGDDDDDEDDNSSGGYSFSPTPAKRNGDSTASPCAKALYDFEPENDGELEFVEGDMITLTGRIDENWLEGTVNGKSGYFPVNYVEIINDLP